MAIYGFGPHLAGRTISYPILFSTHSTFEVILINYGYAWGMIWDQNMFTLTLKNGTPQLYISTSSILRPDNEYKLNDNSWHQVAVSMPKDNCALSEVVMYSDG